MSNPGFLTSILIWFVIPKNSSDICCVPVPELCTAVMYCIILAKLLQNVGTVDNM